MEGFILIEVKIYPRLKKLDCNVIELRLKEDSNVKNIMERMGILGGKEFQIRFYQDGKSKSNILVNGKAANLRTVVKDKDVVTLIPYIGGG